MYTYTETQEETLHYMTYIYVDNIITKTTTALYFILQLTFPR